MFMESKGFVKGDAKKFDVELRRLHNDLIMCYKIVFGLVDMQFSNCFSLSPSEATRGHQFKLYKLRGHGVVLEK